MCILNSYLWFLTLNSCFVIDSKYIFVFNEKKMNFMSCVKFNPHLFIIIYDTIFPFMLLIKDSLLLWQIVRKQETMKPLK